MLYGAARHLSLVKGSTARPQGTAGSHLGTDIAFALLIVAALPSKRAPPCAPFLRKPAQLHDRVKTAEDRESALLDFSLLYPRGLGIDALKITTAKLPKGQLNALI